MSDYLDIPDLQRRGILKKGAKTRFEGKKFSDSVQYNSQASSAKFSGSASPFDFLDSLAKTNSSSPAQPQSLLSGSAITEDINIKLENFEYKLDRFLERITEIENKIREFENKVSRKI